MPLDASIVEAVVDQHRAADPFSGVVLVREHGHTIFEHAYGLAQRSEALPNTLSTRFATASGSKTFTAVAICQLVARCRLTFDTPLAACVGVPLPWLDPGVTIHHLLTHTSGIPDYFDEEIMDDYAALWHDLPVYRLRSPADFLPLLESRSMKFPPGTRFHYNNAGFVILALVAEHVTGMAFSKYVTQNVFEASGMSASGYFATDQLPARTAYGYIDDGPDGEWRTNVFAVPVVGGGDGGAYVTAPDVVTFWENLLNDTLLPHELTRTFLTPHVQAHADYMYGYGIWVTQSRRGGMRYMKSGGDPGVTFRSSCYPKLALEIVAIGNTSQGAGKIARALENLAESETFG